MGVSKYEIKLKSDSKLTAIRHGLPTFFWQMLLILAHSEFPEHIYLISSPIYMLTNSLHSKGLYPAIKTKYIVGSKKKQQGIWQTIKHLQDSWIHHPGLYTPVQ